VRARLRRAGAGEVVAGERGAGRACRRPSRRVAQTFGRGGPRRPAG